jgi:hypothetical protein
MWRCLVSFGWNLCKWSVLLLLQGLLVLSFLLCYSVFSCVVCKVFSDFTSLMELRLMINIIIRYYYILILVQTTTTGE